MSIDLHVDATAPIPLAAIQAPLCACLQELLDVRGIPAIHVVELRDGVRSPAQMDARLDSGSTFIFDVEGHPASVVIDCVESEDHGQESGVHRFIGIMAGGDRSPLEFALMAAVAVIVARRERSPIVDGARFFTPSIQNDVDTFVATVRVKGPFADSITAAKQFDRNLNQTRRPPSG